jgi:transposase
LKKNNLFSRLTRALMLREDVQDLFNSYISYDESDAKLKRLIKRMQMFKSLAFKKLGKMFLKNFEAIKNYFKYRLTNAILESNNTKIQKAKAQANGFRNIEYFRNIIFLKLGDLNIKDIFKTKLGLS